MQVRLRAIHHGSGSFTYGHNGERHGCPKILWPTWPREGDLCIRGEGKVSTWP